MKRRGQCRFGPSCLFDHGTVERAQLELARDERVGCMVASCNTAASCGEPAAQGPLQGEVDSGSNSAGALAVSASTYIDAVAVAAALESEADARGVTSVRVTSEAEVDVAAVSTAPSERGVVESHTNNDDGKNEAEYGTISVANEVMGRWSARAAQGPPRHMEAT